MTRGVRSMKLKRNLPPEKRSWWKRTPEEPVTTKRVEVPWLRLKRRRPERGDSRPSSARSPLRVDRGYISRLGKRVAVDDMHDKRVVVDNVLNQRAGVDNVHDKRAGVDVMNRENIQDHLEHEDRVPWIRLKKQGGTSGETVPWVRLKKSGNDTLELEELVYL